jgi:hypothetical protein
VTHSAQVEGPRLRPNREGRFAGVTGKAPAGDRQRGKAAPPTRQGHGEGPTGAACRGPFPWPLARVLDEHLLPTGWVRAVEALDGQRRKGVTSSAIGQESAVTPKHLLARTHRPIMRYVSGRIAGASRRSARESRADRVPSPSAYHEEMACLGRPR